MRICFVRIFFVRIFAGAVREVELIPGRGGVTVLKLVRVKRAEAARFIIVNVKLLVVDTQFLVRNAKFRITPVYRLAPLVALAGHVLAKFIVLQEKNLHFQWNNQ